MIIRCIKTLPDLDDEVKVGHCYKPGHQEFGIEIYKKYIVYGMSILNGSTWVDISPTGDYLYPVPLCLFEMVDSKVSKYWEFKVDEDGDIFLWYSSAFEYGYHSRLADNDPIVVENFQKMRNLIESEVDKNIVIL